MFGIAQYEKCVFSNNFLKNIILKLNYRENKTCTSNRSQFIETFKYDFPIITDGVAQEIALTMGAQQNGQTISIKNNSDAHRIIMRSKNSQNEFALTNDFLQYKETGNSYKSSQNFDLQIIKALDFLKKSNTTECKNLSLRKVNFIDFATNNSEGQEIFTYEPLRELLAPQILCIYEAFASCNKYIKQNIYSLQLEESDYILNVKYGYIVSEKNLALSNVKGQIVIDLSLEKRSVSSFDSLNEDLQKCHQELYNAFRWCISDKMLEILKQG